MRSQPGAIELRHRSWYGDAALSLPFPESWDVTCCRMAGHDRAVLGPQEMAAALRQPIGAPRLAELAKGKKRAVILFDDFTRPQPTHEILPAVLDELRAGGLADDAIRFVTAYGAHRAMTTEEIAKKLGEDVVARHLVFNHNIYEHLVDCGTTERGTRVSINREVAESDLRIAIGGVVPHLTAGFGGGGKMMIPGVASADTIGMFHVDLADRLKLRTGEGSGAGLGRIEGNELRADIEDAARLAGLHFKVDLITNGQREVIGVFAGDFVAAHREACRFATETYATPVVRDADVVVANTYPIENQAVKSAWPMVQSLRPGGTGVLVSFSPEGTAAHHFLVSRFGTDYGGRMYGGRGELWFKNAAHLIVLSDRLSRYERELFGQPEKIHHARTWDAVLAELKRLGPDNPKTAVYPYAAIQMPAG